MSKTLEQRANRFDTQPDEINFDYGGSLLPDGELSDSWLEAYGFSDHVSTELLEEYKTKPGQERLRVISKTELLVVLNQARQDPDERTSRLFGKLFEYSEDYFELKRTQVPGSEEWEERIIMASATAAFIMGPLNLMLMEAVKNGASYDFQAISLLIAFATCGFFARKTYKSRFFTSVRPKALAEVDRDGRLMGDDNRVDPKQVELMIRSYKRQTRWILNEFCDNYDVDARVDNKRAAWVLSRIWKNLVEEKKDKRLREIEEEVLKAYRDRE